MPEFDVRRFPDLTALLNAWCADHPERTTYKSIEELARFAGCSWGLMRRVLDGKGKLTLGFVTTLAQGMGLPDEQAAHLRRLGELQFAPPEDALKLRVEIWRTYADTFGLPWDDASSQIHEKLPHDQVIAALGPALAALGDEMPSAKRLFGLSVMPLQEDQVVAALATLPDWQAHQTAPRMITLPPPTDPASATTWQGALGRAIEAIGRAPPGQMRCWCSVAALDAEAEEALKEIDGRLYGKLAALAEEAELRPASRVVFVLKQHLPLTVVQRIPDPNGSVRWYRPPGVLQAIQDADKVEANMKSAEPFTPAAPDGTHRHTASAPLPTGFLDFETYLAAWRSWRELHGEQHSEGYIALQTKLKRATIHDLARGRTRLGPQHIPGFIKLLGISDDKDSQAALEGMSQFVAGHGPGVLGKLALTLRSMGAKRERRHPETEAWFVCSRWYAQAICLLAELKGFQPSTGRIGRSLMGRVTWPAIEEALIALFTLGLLREGPDGVVRPTAADVRVEGKLADLSHAQLHTSVLRLFRSEVELGEPGLLLSGAALALPEKALAWLDRIFDQTQTEVQEVLDAAEARRAGGAVLDRLALISWQVFPHFILPARRRP